MYKLVALLALVAVCSAKPSGYLAYSAPVLTSAVVAPAVTSYSSHSSAIVHGSPVLRVAPHHVVATPFVSAPVVHHIAPVHAYSAHGIVSPVIY